MGLGAYKFRVAMKRPEFQYEYEYLVLHAESEKVHFMDLITTAERLRVKLFDANDYKEINKLSEELRRVKSKASQSKKLLAKMGGKLAELLKIGVI